MDQAQRGPFTRESLGDDLALARLAEAPMARVVISVRCLPAALPVFVHVGRHHVLLASHEDAVIEAARRGDVLAVQVDGTEPDGATWSVQVTGVAHLPEQTDSIVAAGLNERVTEATESGAVLVAIPLTVIAGERIRWSFPR
jgi:hypothetical protein